jgi:signal transduction histidine kinase
MLHQANPPLTCQVNLQAVLETILESALNLVAEMQAVYIFLAQSDGLALDTELCVGRGKAQPVADPCPCELIYTIARQGQPVVVPDCRVHPLCTGAPPEWTGGVAGLPLQLGARLVGVLVAVYQQPRAVSEAELRALRLLTDLIAMAIENGQLRRTLAEALRQQQDIERLKGEFVQNVSHELRTPLTIVLGHAELLASGEMGELPREQREPVAAVARHARKLSQLVDNLTALLDAGAWAMKHEQVDLAGLVRTRWADFQSAAKRAGVAWAADIAPGALPVRGDHTYLRQVVDNLFDNALKFTPPGGAVTVRVWQEEASVALEVADTGIGISGDKLERIFERFYQVDGSMTRRYRGAGLGLAVVKEIVEAHGGQVTVQSAVGQGSAFRVVLPGAQVC